MTEYLGGPLNPDGFDASASDADADGVNTEAGREPAVDPTSGRESAAESVIDSAAEAGETVADRVGTGPTGVFDSPLFDSSVFDGVVFDEAFVLAALIHEPSAAERTLALRVAAGRKRSRARATGSAATLGVVPLGVMRGRHQVSGRWQRAVARLMLVVIGLLAVMVAVAAVYRGAGVGVQPTQSPGTGSNGNPAASTPALVTPR